MAVTRLERKGRKNKNVAKKRVTTMKRLNALPTIKNVDIEAIKAEFTKNAKSTPKVEKEVPKAEAVNTPVKDEKKVEAKKASPKKDEEAPKAEKKETKKAATPKKTTKKA